MTEHNKQSVQPVFTGCLMSVLLIVSFFLPRFWQDNNSVESFNTLLIVAILCLAVHLIRKTSGLFYSHVWKSLGFTILWIIPVFNLLITACQFVWGNLVFIQHPLFSGLLVLFSLPAFCCYFFTVICIYCIKDKRLMISTVILDAFGLIYILMRLADRSILPLAEIAGRNITVFVEKLFSVSPYFSFIIYVLSFANFIICAGLFREHINKSEQTNTDLN